MHADASKSQSVRSAGVPRTRRTEPLTASTPGRDMRMTRLLRRRTCALFAVALAATTIPGCGHQPRDGGANDTIKIGGHPVQLTIADEGDGPATALPAATKMIKQDRVDVLTGIVGGGSVAAIAPLV